MGKKIDGAKHDPFLGFRFRVEIDGADHAAYSKVGPLEEESEVVEWRDGDSPPHMNKMPGLVKFGDITLEEGLCPDDFIRIWRNSVHTLFGNAKPSPEFRKNMLIKLQDPRTGTVLKTWAVYDCWPSKYAVAEFSSESSDVALETATITNEGWKQLNVN